MFAARSMFNARFLTAQDRIQIIIIILLSSNIILGRESSEKRRVKNRAGHWFSVSVRVGPSSPRFPALFTSFSLPLDLSPPPALFSPRKTYLPLFLLSLSRGLGISRAVRSLLLALFFALFYLEETKTTHATTTPDHLTQITTAL